MLRFLFKTLKFQNFKNNIDPFQKSASFIINFQQQEFYSNKPSSNILLEKDPETGEVKKRKTTIIPKITLLHGDAIDVVTLEEAQKIARRRDLKLVKILDVDTKSNRTVYKLMSGTEVYEEELKQREKKKSNKQQGTKGEKLLNISQNISKHDLEVHITKIAKWLAKKYEVRLVINGDGGSMRKAEQVCSDIEHSLKSVSDLIQKKQSGSTIKLQVLPAKEEIGNEDTGKKDAKL
ncbi:translation initiation factor IF-3, mitochondrial [Cylas formicarius]|uniref:translation initiation factor IF-3, mitochondrial n=1 Tax=Cylas formicarius TaxID=197179 RepID=UPI0029587DA7|nr:translation initiation factor IF-3, mitochondrial [Cylas formicarius]